ncbi:MAG: transketolase family protein [Defluviitaleaceae bacterium]|nr:transketolase family protein [Defluviitaleaceae bacterium]
MDVKSQRIAYGEALVELGTEHEGIVVLEADLGKSTMSFMFEEKFPCRYFEMGIAEANMISVATGLSLAGKVPFCSTFAVFATGRAYDQIRVGAIAGLNFNICGSSCGLSDFGDGSTHQSVEDIAIMRAIPGMTVLSPADAHQTKKMVRAMADHPGPCYIRVNRSDLPILTESVGEYKIGQIDVLRDGAESHVVIFATGIMVSMALEAAEKLAETGIAATVANVGTIKPLDKAAVLALAAKAELVVTAEEHSIVGGLGSAISETLQGNLTRPIRYVGIDDQFGTSALTYDELLVHYGLTVENIVEAACGRPKTAGGSI